MSKPILKTVVTIIGSGPAAYTAAIYASRANLEPLLFEGSLEDGMMPGGQLTTTTDVENFPGFPDGISGYELVTRMREQAVKYGTKMFEETILKCEKTPVGFRLESNHHYIESTTVIIATGASAKKLTFDGSELFWNNGISACAVCDGACPIFRNKPLAVIGGGDSAMEEAIFLTKFASKVYIIHRRDELRASKYMQKKAFVCSTTVVKAYGNDVLEGIEIKNLQNGVVSKLECNGLFYAIGHTPNTHLFEEWVDLDDKKYINTNGASTFTNVKGLFACGDVQDSKWRQAITAAGSGCIAALEVEKYLA